jgi:RNA polymerase sigma-70 factor (ECF subfamily)
MPLTDDRSDGASDMALITRWQSGDERAATQLVERYAAAVTRFVGSLGLRHDIDDVVQETFVRAFGALDAFRAESTFRTWLFTIARRLVIDQRRAGGRRREVDEVGDELPATRYDALDTIVADEAATHVRRAVASLSPMQRDVFLLRVNEGLSYREIAEMLDSTEGAARVHYHHALRTVKESLHV